MCERRPRTTKAVNYAALDGGLSDDEDFICFTPPAKKKKEPVKQRTRIKVKEKEEKPGVCKKKSPPKRPTLEERKFKRELEIALKLSATDGNESLDDLQNSTFKGFGTGLEDTNIVQENNSIPDSELNEGNDILSRSNGECAALNSEVLVDVHQLSTSDDEPVPTTSKGLAAKRNRKKVSFIKDEDSDDDDDDDEISEDVSSSDTDEDFCLSPNKKHSSNIPKIGGKKCTKKKVPKNFISKIDKSNLEKQLKPVAIKLTTIKEDLTNHTNDDDALSNIHCIKQNCSPTFKPSTVKTLATPVSNYNKSSITTPTPLTSLQNVKTENSASNSANSKGSIRLVKTPFKSPSIGSSRPSASIIQSTGVSLAKTGLRLGLSRRGHFKSLHPNVLSQ